MSEQSPLIHTVDHIAVTNGGAIKGSVVLEVRSASNSVLLFFVSLAKETQLEKCFHAEMTAVSKIGLQKLKREFMPKDRILGIETVMLQD